MAPIPCVRPAARPLATGVTSAFPVLLLASGLNVPDDLFYSPDDGSVLVGEHGNGHIDIIGGPRSGYRFPQVVPEAEGITIIDNTVYVADQQDARVVALTQTGLRTVIQLQPVPSGENLDGISADVKGTGLVVPDSPHGVVLLVDVSGHVTARFAGFSRPAGSWPETGGYLIADENASAVFEIKDGSVMRIAGGLPGADDAVRSLTDGHVLAILPAAGQLRDVSTGRNIAIRLRNPQGLGFDGAQNVLVTESDIGRLDLLVRTFAVQVPAGAIQLQPGQPVCIGLMRAPGYTSNVTFHEVVGGDPVTDPGTTSQGEVVPAPCHAAICTVSLVLRSAQGDEYARFTYRD